MALVTPCVIIIRSFGNRETSKIWEGERTRKIPVEIQEIARRKLRMLNSSQDLKDLMTPPSNRLEKLKGNYNAFYSIRVNDQWRIIFRWNNGNSEAVELIDYH